MKCSKMACLMLTAAVLAGSHPDMPADARQQAYYVPHLEGQQGGQLVSGNMDSPSKAWPDEVGIPKGTGILGDKASPRWEGSAGNSRIPEGTGSPEDKRSLGEAGSLVDKRSLGQAGNLGDKKSLGEAGSLEYKVGLGEESIQEGRIRPEETGRQPEGIFIPEGGIGPGSQSDELEPGVQPEEPEESGSQSDELEPGIQPEEPEESGSQLDELEPGSQPEEPGSEEPGELGGQPEEPGSEEPEPNGQLREAFSVQEGLQKDASKPGSFTGKEGAANAGEAGEEASLSLGQPKGAAAVVTPKKPSAKLAGESSNNRAGNDYRTYGKVVGSYLSENADGTFDRIENIATSGIGSISQKLVVETYDSVTKKRKRKQEIKSELPIFGGFFSGDACNYIVFGQGNSTESDSKEVLRAVKYSKSWKRLGSVSIYGANTVTPFYSGSLRMEEVGGKLYIHTCHLMYRSMDDIRHQANMTFVIDVGNMELVQELSMVANNSSGYVSHSFNQFVQSDGQYVYRADHGDGYPRGVMISRCEADGHIADVECAYPIEFDGSWGQNYTGASIGGFELSSDACLVAGNSIAQGEGQGLKEQRNIFVTVTSKDFSNSSIAWITKHKGGDIAVSTPHLVEIAESQFLLLWEEEDRKTGKKATKLVTIDGNARLTSKVTTCWLPLSDCKPVQFRNGLVNWYVTENSAPVLYSVNPYDLNAAKERKVSKISITGLSGKIAAGKKIKLSAKVTPQNATDRSVKWKSSNTKVASVSQSGVVTLKKGSGGKSVKITVAAQDGSGVKATYKITSQKGVVKKVSISGRKPVKAGKSLQLKGKVSASKGANKKLKWESSNKKYATVSSSGKVKAKAAGKGKKVKITASATDGSGKKKTVTIAIK